jgi:CDP-diacylglycerol--glycerol-3-phosphate 3-phosphatidyltransferase
MSLIDAIRNRVRAVMRTLARWLNAATGGKLHPDMVTVFGFLMHVPIALFIGSGHFGWAALFLLVFGLFDTLDGELARLQKRDSPSGMLLDASTDRMKEVLIYTGIAYYFAMGDHPATAAWACAALGASVCVSYVKAKGEAAVAAGKPIPHATLNRMFKDGLLTFELRMFVLLVGLLTGWLLPIVAAIAILASYTALQRLVLIGKALR